MQRPEERPLWHGALIVALIAIPLAVAAARYWHLAPPLESGISLESLPKHVRRHLEYLLFIPLSTAVVAFFRLTLGIQVLSLFRPVLIAIAFQRMGILLGLPFLALALLIVVFLRPVVKGRPYYARVSVIAAGVVILMVLALIGFEKWRAGWLMHVSYFPVIALCLTCESFASTLAKAGAAEALWRAVTTVIEGLLIMWVGQIPGFVRMLAHYPELLFMQAGCVLAIAQFFSYRLLEGWNPFLAAKRGEDGSGNLGLTDVTDILEVNG